MVLVVRFWSWCQILVSHSHVRHVTYLTAGSSKTSSGKPFSTPLIAMSHVSGATNAEFRAACHRAAHFIHQCRVDGHQINQGLAVGVCMFLSCWLSFLHPLFLSEQVDHLLVSVLGRPMTDEEDSLPYATVPVPQQFSVCVCLWELVSVLRQQCHYGLDESEGLPPNNRCSFFVLEGCCFCAFDKSFYSWASHALGNVWIRAWQTWQWQWWGVTVRLSVFLNHHWY